MMVKDYLFLLISNVLGRGCGAGECPLMMMKDFSLLLISNVSGRGFGAGRGPTDDEGVFFASADFKCFRKVVWGWGEGPTNKDG